MKSKKFQKKNLIQQHTFHLAITITASLQVNTKEIRNLLGSLLEITNLTVRIQKLAQHIIKLRNITVFAYYMIC